ncbi:TonB-dependent receptor [Fulvivirga sp. M361]|uniref:TonB-dependent receptor n=1 Tax=Fulvivirga sp. M361 TaxID=2594266 RepID=UPI001179ACB4|nr:TonB-dependent receptor [Fulvivirga sp. M361]TRX60029.1 TonB-dependent receptor [Fulvivirga sp. M361]
MSKQQIQLFILLLVIPHSIRAQNDLLSKRIQLDSSNGTIEEVLDRISEHGGFTFSYSNQLDLTKNVHLQIDNQTVRSLLDQLFSGEVQYVASVNKIILYSKRDKKKDTTDLTIHGSLKDINTGEALYGANVWIKELATGVSGNAYGFYALTVPPGRYTLYFSYVGYETLKKEIKLQKDLKMDVELSADTTELDVIEITSDAALKKNVFSEEMSIHRLSIESIENMPVFGANPDVIKSIQLLPGVTTVGEGSTGFFVRGGGRDQNLILLDEAPVYNPSHFLGFLSVFNTDAINNMTFYKGGIPARHGGRASSILDIRMKEGNTREFTGSGGISLVGGAKLTVGAPIRKGKGSFMMSGRRTYADPLFWALGRVEPLAKGIDLFFYDLNAKANYTINEKNRLFISGYFGRDVNTLPILDFDVRWGNQTGTLRWNHLFSNRLFSNFTLTYSGYDYKLDIPAAQVPVGWESTIRDINFKGDFTLFANPTTTLNFGLQSIHHSFNPGSNDFDPQFNVPNSNALESGVYLSMEKEIGSSISLEAGVRGSLFQNIGETSVFKFDDDFMVVDTTQYTAGEWYKSRHNLEPRLSARFLIDEKQSIKVSYNRMAQYLHLLANSSLSFTAFDVWYPSGPNIEPLLVDQITIGFFRNFRNNQIEASIEGYYKNIDNQIDYKDFARIAFNPVLEGDLRTGKAWSYGIEFFLKKKTGKLTGWMSYTWSRAIHKIPGINNGGSFPAIYDQPHKIAITSSYQLSKKFSFGANWTYNTGGPLTLPVESYTFEGQAIPVPVYNSRNASRLPDYHRLDLSAKLNSQKKIKDKIKVAYVLSVYNAYARQNALAVFVGDDLSNTDDEADPRVVGNKVSLFSIIPTASLLFSF